IEENLGKGAPQVPEGMEDLINRLENPEAAGITSEDSDVPDTEPADRPDESGEFTQEVTGQTVELNAGENSDSPDKATTSKTARTQKAGAMKTTVDETARVSTRRLDDLINMVGELVIANAMISQNSVILNDKDRSLQMNVAQISKIVRDLQDLSISMRMVPLKGVFQKMLRLVRDLARKSNKNVQFVIEGEDTEIDRTMVESLNDPLVHMIRNAMDHGIESREVRRDAGKPEKGTLRLRAYHAAGNVVIELEDDGKGLDLDKILAKAKKKGLVEPDKDLPDNEVFMLIFSAGLSTADKITDISGRGVGMDVVKKNIESMRGRVEVMSAKGEGSKFTIRIPLTLAIIDSMLVKVGNENFLIPTLNVSHVFRPEATAISSVQGKGEMFSHRGSFIPLYRLHEVFDVPEAKTEPTECIIIVVVDSDGEEYGLLLDELVGKQQVVIKSLNKGLGELDGISGAAILGDGKVGLILDINGVTQVAKTIKTRRKISTVFKRELSQALSAS
ncbi:MAG: chemotaxis protein CheA, partial [Planctomycetes bacterium]|nr:chemotaxis protein CheA [Planctomycetota bacterium]